jgi:hypothetical protein
VDNYGRLANFYRTYPKYDNSIDYTLNPWWLGFPFFLSFVPFSLHFRFTLCLLILICLFFILYSQSINQ